MNSDPDFQPLAGAWLSGEATPPEQKLLREILTENEEMETFGRLCLTESLLCQSGDGRNERLEALGMILSGNARRRRAAYAAYRRTPWVWISTAAAMAALAWWIFQWWPGGSESKTPVHRIPVSVMDSVPEIVRVVQPGEEALPPAAPGLGIRLRRLYVPEFKAQGNLQAAAETLNQRIRSIDGGLELRMGIKSDGDSSVFLRPADALPAWTLAQMMAAQSGTKVQLTGNTLLFLAADPPLAMTGSQSTFRMARSLNRLLGLPWKGDSLEDWEAMSRSIAERFNGSVVVQIPPASGGAQPPFPPYLCCTGNPRLLRVLGYALNAMGSQEHEIHYTVLVIKADPGAAVAGQAQPVPQVKPGIAGVFTEVQMQTILAVAKKNRGQLVRELSGDGFTGTAWICDFFPGETGNYRGTFECTANEDGKTVDVNCVLEGGESDQRVSTQVLIWKGQTVSLDGYKGPDGAPLTVYITPTVQDAAPATENGSEDSGDSRLRPKGQ